MDGKVSKDGSIKMKFGRFGEVSVYNSKLHTPSALYVFLSGDGAWNAGVVDMARAIGAEDSVVVGVSVPAYLKALRQTKAKCHYPAGDLESLSHFIQKKLDFKYYVRPVLVGYSSGATLAYATLVQAPEGSYDGAITLGFCPDFMIDRPLCRGNGLESVKRSDGKGIDFLPKNYGPEHWIVLNGLEDKVCKVEEQRQFISGIPGAKLVAMPKVGHGFGVQKNWMPQLIEAANEFKVAKRSAMPNPDGATLQDLPIIENNNIESKTKYFAVILSGDGGWAGIDRALSGELHKQGIKSVGLDSLRYFWNKKSPDILARDLTRIVENYSSKWKLEHVVFIGYSFGADVLPFALTRLTGTAQKMTVGSVYLGPSQNADFEFHVTDWLDASDQDGESVSKEIGKVSSIVPQLCLYSDDDEDSSCLTVKGSKFVVKHLAGGHHFGGDYEGIAKFIEDFVGGVTF